jgi:hypothetical protein
MLLQSVVCAVPLHRHVKYCIHNTQYYTDVAAQYRAGSLLNGNNMGNRFFESLKKLNHYVFTIQYKQIKRIRAFIWINFTLELLLMSKNIASFSMPSFSV